MPHEAVYCRACLRTSDTNCTALLPLAESYIATPAGAEHISYLDCWRYCTRLEEEQHVEAKAMSQRAMMICGRCSKALQVAYHFIKLARESHEKLMAQYGMKRNEKSNATVTATADDDKEVWALAKNMDMDESVGSKLVNPTMNHEPQEVAIQQQNGTVNETNDFDLTCDNISNAETVLIDENMTTEQLNNNDNVTHFIDEIKENLINAHGYMIVRNKLKVIDDPKELPQAIDEDKSNEADSNELACTFCNSRFTNVRAFITHINHHRGITPFRCNKCNYFTCYSESLRKHYKREHGIEATNDMLDKRIDPQIAPTESQFHEKTFFCLHCNFKSFEVTDMKVHLMNEHLLLEDLGSQMRSVYNCPDCHRQFKDQKAMHTHFTLMHAVSMDVKKPPKDTFPCQFCDKQFQLKASLSTHQNVCRLRNAIACDICSKKFSSIRRFEHHLRHEHSVEMIYECEVCNKTFKSPISFEMHRKRHTESHFQCNLCSSNYVNDDELKDHIERVHGNEPKAQCRVCGQTFANQERLRQHESQHCQTVYKCHFCDYQCKARCSLRLHEYQHTGMPYKCLICSREFALKAHLRRHAKNLHSVELSEQELTAMFHKKIGYKSRYDALDCAKSTRVPPQVTEADIENELKEFGLNFDDMLISF